jgi:hypothetical protein
MKKKEFTEVEVQIHKYYEPNVEYSTVKQMWNGRENTAAMINNICNPMSFLVLFQTLMV